MDHLSYFIWEDDHHQQIEYSIFRQPHIISPVYNILQPSTTSSCSVGPSCSARPVQELPLILSETSVNGLVLLGTSTWNFKDFPMKNWEFSCFYSLKWIHSFCKDGAQLTWRSPRINVWHKLKSQITSLVKLVLFFMVLINPHSCGYNNPNHPKVIPMFQYLQFYHFGGLQGLTSIPKSPLYCDPAWFYCDQQVELGQSSGGPRSQQGLVFGPLVIEERCGKSQRVVDKYMVGY